MYKYSLIDLRLEASSPILVLILIARLLYFLICCLAFVFHSHRSAEMPLFERLPGTGWRVPHPTGDGSSKPNIDVCKSKYLELKRKKKYRYLIFKIVGRDIVVEKIGEAGGINEDRIHSLKALLPPSFCRYVVYDFFEPNAPKEQRKIFFLTWHPKNARGPASEYETRSDWLVKELGGIDIHVIARSLDDVDYQKIKNTAARLPTQPTHAESHVHAAMPDCLRTWWSS